MEVFKGYLIMFCFVVFDYGFFMEGILDGIVGEDVMEGLEGVGFC